MILTTFYENKVSAVKDLVNTKGITRKEGLKSPYSEEFTVGMFIHFLPVTSGSGAGTCTGLAENGLRWGGGWRH